jgi:hypothetical protein
VFYSLGVLINLVCVSRHHEAGFLALVRDSAVQLLRECSSGDMEVVGLCLKLLLSVSEAHPASADALAQELPALLARYHEQCDLALGMKLRRASRAAG